MSRMRFSLVNDHAYVLYKLNQTMMLNKYMSLDWCTYQNFDMVMSKQLEHDHLIHCL